MDFRFQLLHLAGSNTATHAELEFPREFEPLNWDPQPVTVGRMDADPGLGIRAANATEAMQGVSRRV